ncbi:MAG: hypothetical protein DSY42_00135 [Aquifex sp.]|nr:MAG: hypothetical protein DSY42_00135 [Aquifex sp.]
MLPLVLTAVGVATITAITGTTIIRDIKQEQRRIACLELVKQGKVKADYCVQFDQKSIVEDIRKTINDAGKMAMVGGALYLLAKFVERSKK